MGSVSKIKVSREPACNEHLELTKRGPITASGDEWGRDDASDMG